ncbi:unnamed protein product [Caenorhabditis auriculariae]|uniref:Uncharacterized protein n=1 Tax=Caenorhabditis auriculariae TaxID=2777116 RepID=A0A8S1HRJ3_9PELO|nr:unnamed protein product [Caenorhabditis auriculariae]
MTSQDFEQTRSLLSESITIQREGVDAAPTLEKLLPILQKVANGRGEARTTVGMAVLVAATPLLQTAQKTGNMSRIYARFAEAVEFAFDCIPDPVNIPLVPFKHLSPILCESVRQFPEDTPTAIAATSIVGNVLGFIFKSQWLRQGLYSPSFVPKLSNLLITFIEIAKNREKDVSLRKKSLKLVRILVECCPNEAIVVLSTLLPGISSKLANVASDGANDNAEVVEDCLAIVDEIVVKCLKDSTFEEEVSKKRTDCSEAILQLIVTRDDKWREEAALGVVELLKQLPSSLAKNRHESVRFALLRLLRDVFVECEKSFNGTLDVTIHDICLLLCDDVFEGTRILAEELSNVLRQRNPAGYELHLHEKLRQVAERLPVAVRAGDGATSLSQLKSVLLGLRTSLPALAAARSPSLLLVLQSLISSIRLDEKRLMITKQDPPENYDEFLNRFPLKYDIRSEDLATVCEVLATQTQGETLDWTSSELLGGSVGECFACSFVVCRFLVALEKSSDRTPDEALFISSMQPLLQVLEEYDATYVPPDDVIEGTSSISNVRPALACLSCVSLSILIQFLDRSEKKTKVVVDMLYVLLRQCSSETWMVAEAADFSIGRIAKRQNLSQSEFLNLYGSYVAHRILLASSSSTEHLTAAVVFSSFLQRVTDASFFESCRQISDLLLAILDSHEQKNTLLVLRALHSYIRAINVWFPEINVIEPATPSSSKQNDDVTEALVDEAKPTPPAEAVHAEKVLLRVKQMLLSPHLPVRLVALDVTFEGLWALRKIDDLLLPMVHQNWVSLMSIMRDEEPLARIAGLQVIARMADLSKSFVSRRIVTELWPLMEGLMRVELKRKAAYSQTASFRLQMAVLQTFPQIFRDIEANEEELSLLKPLLEDFSRKASHVELRKAADEGISLLSGIS